MFQTSEIGVFSLFSFCLKMSQFKRLKSQIQTSETGILRISWTSTKNGQTNIGNDRTSKWLLRIYATRQPSLNGSSIRLKYQCPNIHKRIFIDFDFKRPKIGIYTKSIQTKINCTRISVRNSYLTFEDNYKRRCEIKISPWTQTNEEEARKQRRINHSSNATQEAWF